MKRKPYSEIDYVRKLAESALWNILFHEEELTKAYHKLALLKAVIERGQYTEINLEEIKIEQVKRLAESNDD